MRKLSALAALIAAFAIETYSPPPANACGVKLAIRYSRPRRTAAISAAPSHVLLVGSPPKRLEHDLKSAGHEVEIEPSSDSAKRPSYDIVVVANNDEAVNARQKFPAAAVIVRSGDVTADVRSIEGQASRHPIAVASGRAVIAAGPAKEQPVAVRPPEMRKVGAKPPDETRPVMAAKQPDEARVVEVKPTEQPKVEAKVEPKAEVKAEPEAKQEAKEEHKIEAKTGKPETETTAPATKPAAGPASIDQEVYFLLGSANLSDKRRLDRAVTWLKANPDVHAAIDGFADPSGTHEVNMTLSQQRAEAVRDYLVSQGIDTSRLDVTPFGDTKMKYGKNDGHNRRVEISAKR